MQNKHIHHYNGYAVQPSAHRLPDGSFSSNLLLERAGIHDDAYYALTQVLAPSLAKLTRAPGATPPPIDARQQQFDNDMASVAVLRMKGKLDKWLPASMLPSNTAVAKQDDDGEAIPAAAAMGIHR